MVVKIHAEEKIFKTYYVIADDEDSAETILNQYLCGDTLELYEDEEDFIPYYEEDVSIVDEETNDWYLYGTAGLSVSTEGFNFFLDKYCEENNLDRDKGWYDVPVEDFVKWRLPARYKYKEELKQLDIVPSNFDWPEMVKLARTRHIVDTLKNMYDAFTDLKLFE